MSEKRVLLIIGGGIAAYKAPELVRQLKAQGLATRCLLTAAAEQFVSPLSLASVSGDKVYENLFDLTDEAEMGHIQLSRDADLILVAPATADLIAKMAQGLANDLASTSLLATDKPVMIAPAMNVRMWEHAATQRNLTQLRADGIAIIGPDEGDMACGEFGLGRMSEPSEIALAAKKTIDQAPERETPLLPAKPLAGRKILVTAGPTYEPIDPVRYIANRSSGKQGYALASALSALGAQVHLVSGPTALNDPPNVTTKRVETARQMLEACQACLPVDAAIMAAAVADWRPAQSQDAKIKKTKSGLDDLKLIENPDILATLAAHETQRPSLVVGFAAETNDIESYASEKRVRKKCDWIVANDVSANSGIAGGVMGGDENQIHLLTASGSEPWEVMSKTDVAIKLAAQIATHFTPHEETS
ncbi:bifunctional phosphopantothenoylcysteine decarboxylase/phosphopantothenate--cysteine ligase CoaBC [Alphaproteobacteria bacterium]|nr:bifunctional phosphopantothenoylcysteine decarboxylase/phosphopantothenate--cysteine ligase CoaBC [Alphaproteobacteria bacterium]